MGRRVADPIFLERHFLMGGNSMMILLLQFLAIGLVFYFLIIRPQGQARKRAAEILAALKKGDEITTAGGLVGRVTEIKENLITFECGTAHLKVERPRIIRVGDQATPGLS